MAPSDTEMERELQAAVKALWRADPDNVTVNAVRSRAEESLGLESGFLQLDDWKARSKAFIKDLVNKLIDGTIDAQPEPVKKPEPAGAKGTKAAKNGVKRNSVGDVPAPKRVKKDAPPKKAAKPKPKKKASESELSDLEESEEDYKPKPTGRARKSAQLEESDSELSDIESEQEEEPKPAPRRRSKPIIEEDDEEDDKEDNDSDFGASSPDRKRKRAAPAKPRKQAKPLLDDDDDELASAKESIHVDLKPPRKDKDVQEEIEAKPIRVILGDVSKDDEEEEKNKTEKPKPKTNYKPGQDDTDISDLSEVADNTPPRKKRKSKEPKAASKSKPAPKAAPRELAGDEAEIKKLQGQLVKCGVRKIWGMELKPFGDDNRAKIRHLKDMLHDVGMDGRFSEAKAKEIKERRELMADLEAVTDMNSLWGADAEGRRASRSRAKPSKVDYGDDDDNEGEDEEDGEDAETKKNSRVSKRMADLAFLGDESESD